MLQDLTILNGEISLKFSPYQTKYTVIVKSDVTSLLFDYQVRDGDTIQIYNNDLEISDDVEVKVIHENKETSYFFHVLREEEKISSLDSSFTNLDIIKKDEISPYAVPGISASAFLLILFFFVLLFHKKKSK